jgi:hypothetical protein
MGERGRFMRRVMMIGAGAAALLGLAAPATAGDPVATPASASPGSGNGSAADSAPPRHWDGTAFGANGGVVVMTLSKPRPEPQPRTDVSPAEQRKRASAQRPSRQSD